MIYDMIAVRAARMFFPNDLRLSEKAIEENLPEAARLANLIIKAVNADPHSTKRAVTLPVVGSINEERLAQAGWCVVRDPEEGDALYETPITEMTSSAALSRADFAAMLDTDDNPADPAPDPVVDLDPQRTVTYLDAGVPTCYMGHPECYDAHTSQRLADEADEY
jgi:hypothetical protein